MSANAAQPRNPNEMPRVVGIIPARLHSQRLPRKVLREIAGKPLLTWVHEAASACQQLKQVVVAVDSPEVAELCERNQWAWQMTSPSLASGTDRLAQLAQNVEADIYVNIQGDEPLIENEHIEALLAPFDDFKVDVSTLKTQCEPHEVHDPNAVKVVTAYDGKALYFSRAPIPYDRDGTAMPTYWKHLGLYAYRRAALARFASLSPSELEKSERLEQLRLLENGFAIRVQPVTAPTIGVDTEEDLLRVEAMLTARAQRPWTELD